MILRTISGELLFPAQIWNIESIDLRDWLYYWCYNNILTEEQKQTPYAIIAYMLRFDEQGKINKDNYEIIALFETKTLADSAYTLLIHKNLVAL